MASLDDADDSYPLESEKDILGRRLRLLVDAWEFQNRDTFTFPMLSAHLEPAGLKLSRPRWSYMLNATGFLVSDKRLLSGIASFFDVDEQYLVDLSSAPPSSVVAQLEFVKELREQRVERFAARNLAGVSPETLRLISAAIRTSRAKRREENGSESGS
ncbi:hypothetical protein [Clavibacter michiganensis]|uniref:hypothetical protein n=1 Tax=Clavibacter michiganensis TaxID=28447 RepID=UPI000D52C136|nr:hypothetical protein [Clavibacter michiganensis]AWF96935.1 hypothetical protein BEH61_00285 [Clavibacter michiganensis subsp. insidiosus]